MGSFTEDQITEYQETFGIFDNKGDGKIACKQLGEVLRAAGQNPTEADVRKYYDPNNPDKRITFDQFLPILQEVSRNPLNKSVDDFIDGFRVFDTEQSGHIKSAELRHLLTSLGEKLSDEEVDQLIQGFEDDQGYVNYEDFVKSIVNA